MCLGMWKSRSGRGCYIFQLGAVLPLRTTDRSKRRPLRFILNCEISSDRFNCKSAGLNHHRLSTAAAVAWACGDGCGNRCWNNRKLKECCCRRYHIIAIVAVTTTMVLWGHCWGPCRHNWACDSSNNSNSRSHKRWSRTLVNQVLHIPLVLNKQDHGANYCLARGYKHSFNTRYTTGPFCSDITLF